MADNTIDVAVRIGGDASGGEKAVKSIRQELREAQQEAINLGRKFGDTSREALAAQQRVANLRDEVADFQQRVDALNPDAKFRAFGQALQGVAGGFAGLQGAIGLFGTESEELQKQLLKVQSALALSQGLDAILESREAFKNLALVVRTNVVKAFTTLRGAIIATGVGALAVGLGLLISNFETVKRVVLNLFPGLAQLATYIGGLIQQFTDFFGITSEAERATERLAKQNKLYNDEIDRQIKLLQAQGGQEAKIAELQKQKIQNDVDVLNSKKELSDEEKKLLKDLENEKIAIDIAERKRLKEKADADAKLKQQKINEVQGEIDTIRQANNLAALGAETAEIQQVERKYRLLIDKAKQFGLDTKELEEGLRRELNDIAVKYDKEAADKKKEQDEADLEIAKKKAEAQIMLLEAVADSTMALSDIVGRETAAGKALAVAASLINTYAAIAGQLKAFSTKPIPGYAIAQAIATGLAGFAAVKNIIAVKIPGGYSSGSGGNSGANIPTQSARAPITATADIQQTQLAGQNNVGVNNQDVVRAYVVEKDITDSQDRVAKIKAAATI